MYVENSVNHTTPGKAVSRTYEHIPQKVNIGNTFNETGFHKDRIEIKCFNEQLIEAFQNNDIANKEAFLVAELWRYYNDKLEKLKVTLSEESRPAKLRLLYIYLHVLKRFIIAKTTSN